MQGPDDTSGRDMEKSVVAAFAGQAATLVAAIGWLAGLI